MEQLRSPVPEDAGGYMQDVTGALAGHGAFTERAVLKLVDGPLRRLKAAPGEVQWNFIFEALDRLPNAESFDERLALKGMVSSLLRGSLALQPAEAVRLVTAVSIRKQAFPYKAILTALEKLTMTPELLQALRRLRPMVDEYHGGRDMQEIHERIDALTNGVMEQPVEAAGSWTRHVFQEIDGLPNQMAWRALFLHARTLTQSIASRKWQSEAGTLVERIGREEFLEASHRWLALGPMPGTPNMPVPDNEAGYQKGLIWILGALGDASIASNIADFAVACFRKIPQIGAVSHRVGNACVNALAAMPGLDAVAQISRLSTRVKYDVARRLIEKALTEAAERNHVSREDLEAMSVPTLGLDSNGSRIEVFGACQAKLAIEDGAAVLGWSLGGKSAKSVPAEVKSNHAEALAELKKAVKELDGLLSAARLRLERQLLSHAACPLERWQEWYLQHPVTSVFAKRLIWEMIWKSETGESVQTCMWWQGGLVDWAGNAAAAPPGCAVRLWHPIRSDVQTVLSWRCWLEDHDIRQPFKQAHREVYLLTDAERQTETYSNRFAAHVIRQHQFAALCRERGWQFTLMGQWDSHNIPYLELPQYNLRVEFHVNSGEDSEISGHAIYLVIGTDRVQFMAAGAKAGHFEWPLPMPVPLVDVPPLVFSEAMRDVDLFVGVTSIGCDPLWGVEHPGDVHGEYWNRFAFGELSTLAENRRPVIENLLPKLAIRDRCRMDGRFLVVRGNLGEYRIHMGSGNVITGSGRYLCIVHGPGDTAARLPLPFEGDRMLAVILSKAFLLADDTSIKDETILRQIR